MSNQKAAIRAAAQRVLQSDFGQEFNANSLSFSSSEETFNLTVKRSFQMQGVRFVPGDRLSFNIDGTLIPFRGA